MCLLQHAHVLIAPSTKHSAFPTHPNGDRHAHRTHTPNGRQRAFVCCVNWNCLFLRRIPVENHHLEAAQ